MTEFETDYLAHHGIKGQKWGVRRTPEELGHKPKGSGTKKKVKNAVKGALDSYKQKRSAAKEATEKNAREMLKKYVRKHPKYLPAYANVLTKDEINKLIDDINFDQKLNDIRQRDIDNGIRRLQRTTNKIGTISTLMNNSKNLYNNTIEIYDSIKGTSHRKIGEKKEEDRSDILKIVRSGTAKDVLDNTSRMTAKELEDAVKRLNYEDKLKDRIEDDKTDKS